MLKGVRRFHNGAETHSSSCARRPDNGALGLRPSQFLHDQDWPTELGVIMMAGCARFLIARAGATRRAGGGGGDGLPPVRLAGRSRARNASVLRRPWPTSKANRRCPRTALSLSAAGRHGHRRGARERGRDDGLGGTAMRSSGSRLVCLSRVTLPGGGVGRRLAEQDRRLPDRLPPPSTSRDDCPGVRQACSSGSRQPAAHPAVRRRQGAAPQYRGAAGAVSYVHS